VGGQQTKGQRSKRRPDAQEKEKERPGLHWERKKKESGSYCEKVRWKAAPLVLKVRNRYQSAKRGALRDCPNNGR